MRNTHLLLFPCLLLMGCGGAPCAIEAPASFSSVEELECGLAKDGTEALCNWMVTLAEDGSFVWTYSDIEETGSYECDGDTITATTPLGSVDATWDESTGILTWDGVEYEID